MTRFLLLLGILVFATSAVASDVIYKWKDAQGELHFTDTPPPAGAVVLASPKLQNAPSKAGTMLQYPHLPGQFTADCERTRDALMRDAKGIDRVLLAKLCSQGTRFSPLTPEERHQADVKMAATRKQQCDELRRVLNILEASTWRSVRDTDQQGTRHAPKPDRHSRKNAERPALFTTTVAG